MSLRTPAFACVLLLAWSLAALEPADEARIEADTMEHNAETSIATGTGNVRITYGETVLTADRVSVNQATNDYTVEGNVRITRPDGQWSTDRARGNLDTGEVKFGPFRAGNGVEHSRGEGGKQNRQGKITVNHASVTTCEYEHPHYQLDAAKITYYKSGYYLARHVTLRFFRVPVLYFPVFWGISRKGLRSSYLIQPGYSGKRGAYLRLGRIWKWADGRGQARVYGEGMTKRGLGVGADGSYRDDRREVDLKAYHVGDRDTPETSDGLNRRFESRESRHRIQGYYREQFTDGLSLRMNVDRLSDIDMLEDWFKRDHRANPQPKSFADLTYNHEFFDAQLSVRPRINDFNTVMETLPEMRVDIPALRLGRTPFVYRGGNSLGYYRVKWREFDVRRDSFLPPAYPFDRGENADYAAWRMDSLHTLSLPLDLGGIVNVIPRASFRVTSYSRSSRRRLTERDHLGNLAADSPERSRNPAPVARYDDLGGSQVRYASELGLEVNAKFIGQWCGFDSERLDLHGLRHVVQPYLNYTFAPEPSEDRERLYFFDETDRLTRQNFLRIGLDQRLQTRRQDRIVDWLEWRSYLDLHFADYEDHGHTWGILGNRVELPLGERFRAYGALAYEVSDGEMQRAGAGFTLGRPWESGERKEINLSVGYDYYNDLLPRAAYSMGSDLLDLTGQSGFLKSDFGRAEEITAVLNLPIDGRTWAEIHLDYDLEKSKFCRNHYFLTRVLHCWTVTAGVGWDNDVFEALVMFRLTALPGVKVSMDFY